jgi:hypothetical protein
MTRLFRRDEDLVQSRTMDRLWYSGLQTANQPTKAPHITNKSGHP